jgi:hypothetical protein
MKKGTFLRESGCFFRVEGGVFTRQRELLKLLDEVSSNYIMTIAEANHQTPAQAIGKMVREKIAAGV